MKISQRLIVLFLVSALVPLVCVGLLSSYLSSKALTRQITNQIISVNQRQTNRLELINERNQEVLGVFTAKLRLKLLLQSAGPKLSASQLAELKSIETAYVAENSSLNDVSLLDTSGRVFSTTASDMVDKDFSHEEVFAAVKKGQTTSIFYNDGSGPEIYLAAPLTLNNKLLGYALLESVTNGYLSVVQDYDELGSTGETYIVRPYKTEHLSSQLPLRFNNQATMVALKPIDEASIKASRPGVAFSFLDYRNHEALATVSNLPQTDWKVIVKIDKKEVLAPVRNFLKFIYVISAATILVTVIMAWWFSRIITRPLKKFTAVVEQIQGGDLGQRVQADGRDEIGQLGTAFNEMTDHLMEAQANLEGSILSLSQGFIILGTDGTIHTSNPSVQKLLQMEQAPKTLDEALDGLGNINWNAQLKQCIDTKQGLNFKNVEFKGSFFYIYLTPVTARDQVIGVTVQILDVTEERVLQRSRDEFFSIASHELRTPLTAIRGNIDMIKRFYAEKVGEEDFTQMVDDIHSSSIRLIEIVSDFLDASSLEQGKIKFTLEEFNIEEVIEKVAYETSATASEKGVYIGFEKMHSAAPLVYADKNRVKQVVYNLIGNALKFTEKDGSITLHVTTEDKLLKVSVQDTGRGISEENQKLLFHKFQQAGDSLYTRDTTRGTGLGLYISKLMSEQMGGSLQLEKSVIGKGSTFSFTLPLVSSIPADKRTKAKSQPVATRVLS